MLANLGNPTRNFLGLVVKNAAVGAANTIRKGEPVSWSVAASNPKVAIARPAITVPKDYQSGNYDPQATDEVPLLEVIPGAIDPNGSMGTLNCAGIAVNNIAPGDTGLIAVYGVVKCKVVAVALPQAAGSCLYQFGPTGTDIVFIKAANTNFNIVGIQLQDSTLLNTPELLYCFINILGFGRQASVAPTYTQSTAYYGKAP